MANFTKNLFSITIIKSAIQQPILTFLLVFERIAPSVFINNQHLKMLDLQKQLACHIIYIQF